jgi:hypothetical protein
MRILLVNPPIYDFAAYDFWLKPYGLLSVAGYLSSSIDFNLFDYLDRLHPSVVKQTALESDLWGRGRFYREKLPRPSPLEAVPRYFRRFGLPRELFRDFLTTQEHCDFVLIQTMMTYWYPGVQEVIEDVRSTWPDAKIIFIVPGTNLEPLFEFLVISPDLNQPPFWQAYEKLRTAVLKLTDGCPFKCTYCSVPKVYSKFKARSLEHSLAELELLYRLGVENIAFYDDALLFEPEKILMPILNEVLSRNIKVNFHSPNGLNARFLTKELAELMVRAGFKTFYLGFESASVQWQQRTGSKVSSEELAQAVEYFIAAGADSQNITAYQILGHPQTDIQQLEASMRFVNSLGIRGMLADFSPIPGTPDGEYCRKWVDMDEPLFHNKTAFPVIMLGFDETNRLKDLQRKLNRRLPG